LAGQLRQGGSIFAKIEGELSEAECSPFEFFLHCLYLFAPKYLQIEMDRRWIYKSAPFSPDFMSGVQQFMEHVRGRYGADDKIKCPCRKCLNQKEISQDDVQEHIKINGMSRCYTRWIHHGEEDNDVGQDDDGELAVVPEDMSWDGNEQAPLDEEGQAEDVIEDSARGV